MLFNLVGMTAQYFFNAFYTGIECGIDIFVMLGNDDGIFIFKIDDIFDALAFFAVFLIGCYDYRCGDDIEIVFVKTFQECVRIGFDSVGKFEMSSRYSFDHDTSFKLKYRASPCSNPILNGNLNCLMSGKRGRFRT